ncbi:MAG: hypothetical protein QOI71_781 [Gaiellales bacterium]|jgi:hypothetical protein|nr:hypothetical protein [Gaiellales bacterium]
MIDQPTARKALKELEPLVGEWTLEATPPGGPPWPGDAKATFEWMEGNQLLIERSTIEMREAPDGICVIGCDAANGTYTRLYTDDRGVCRIYEMSIGGGEWRLWREGEPFGQRFSGRFSDEGNRIDGRWETKTENGWETDFDLVYTRVR